MMKKRFYTLLVLSSLGIFLLSASTNYNSTTYNSNSIGLSDTVPQEAFVAPPGVDTIKSPIGTSPNIIAKGEELYNLYCFACHGDSGHGDGPAGGGMSVMPANFHDPKFLKQKEGTVFWKLTNGKGNMPPFKQILKDDQRWQLVAYLKELGKKP